MGNCIRYDAFIANEKNNYYLIIVCFKKRVAHIKKCIGINIDNNVIKCLNNESVSVQFPFSLNNFKGVIEGSMQSYGNWLSKRLSEGKGRLGYVEEMLLKFLAYMICKEQGSIVGCLKSAKILTRRGKVGWKSVYQMFVNSKDLPREEADVSSWITPLPEECIRPTPSVSRSASS